MPTISLPAVYAGLLHISYQQKSPKKGAFHNGFTNRFPICGCIPLADSMAQQLSQYDPRNATLREYLGEAYGNLQLVLEAHGDLSESLDYARTADRAVSSGEKADRLRDAQLWYQKSWDTWQGEPNHGSPDPLGGHDGERVRQELSKYTAKANELKQ